MHRGARTRISPIGRDHIDELPNSRNQNFCYSQSDKNEYDMVQPEDKNSAHINEQKRGALNLLALGGGINNASLKSEGGTSTARQRIANLFDVRSN